MPSRAATVKEYLDGLPADRKAAIAAVRKTILANIDKDVKEGMQYGMIGYAIPHSVYPPGYHCDPKQPLPFAALASQQSHMALYLNTVYGVAEEEEWLRRAWAKTGKTLDMGKSCIRFKRLEDLPLEIVAEAFRRVSAKTYIAHYESVIDTRKK